MSSFADEYAVFHILKKSLNGVFIIESRVNVCPWTHCNTMSECGLKKSPTFQLLKWLTKEFSNPSTLPVSCLAKTTKEFIDEIKAKLQHWKKMMS